MHAASSLRDRAAASHRCTLRRAATRHISRRCLVRDRLRDCRLVLRAPLRRSCPLPGIRASERCMTADRLTYPHRRFGPDHDWFVHESTFKRAPLVWPENQRIALWITVPIEFFPLDAPTLPVRPLGGLDRGYPDFWSYSNRDYGTRIGVFRIMRVLDGLGLRATAMVNATVATRFPRVIDEVMRSNWEIAASGFDMGHAHHGKLKLDTER